MNDTAPKPLAAIATLLVMTLAAGSAAAQSEPEYMDAVMRVGGQMHAAAEMCGFQNVSEAPARKQEQREAAIKRGVSAAKFEAVYAEGYAATKGKMQAATPAQRAQACQELRNLGAK